MSTVAFARISRDVMEEELQSVETGMLNGVTTWEAYQYALGKRRGLMQAIAVIDETTRKFDESQN